MTVTDDRRETAGDDEEDIDLSAPETRAAGLAAHAGGADRHRRAARRRVSLSGRERAGARRHLVRRAAGGAISGLVSSTSTMRSAQTAARGIMIDRNDAIITPKRICIR